MATQARAARQRRAAAIIKAAKRLFGEHGFAATTMDDIAASAQIAKGAVYHHFTTKEAVFAAVFEPISHDSSPRSTVSRGPRPTRWPRWRPARRPTSRPAARA